MHPWRACRGRVPLRKPLARILALIPSWNERGVEIKVIVER